MPRWFREQPFLKLFQFPTQIHDPGNQVADGDQADAQQDAECRRVLVQQPPEQQGHDSCARQDYAGRKSEDTDCLKKQAHFYTSFCGETALVDLC